MGLELNNIYNMSCLDGMKSLDNNSVDAVVTDPPYGLEFMGKEWDTFTGNDTGIIATPPSIYGDKGFKKTVTVSLNQAVIFYLLGAHEHFIGWLVLLKMLVLKSEIVFFGVTAAAFPSHLMWENLFLKV